MQIYNDFSAILTYAALTTLAIWAIDALFFKKRRLANNNDATEPKIVEYSRSFFPILLIVLVLRAFLGEPFRIPSGSMKPNLLEGDFILVNKYTYGIRLPVTGTKVLSVNQPARGDVMVFRYPLDTGINFIKRVIALPGDTVSYRDKILTINGQVMDIKYLESAQDTDPFGRLEQLKKYSENLTGYEHDIYYAARDRLTQDEITVPAGHYFVMGDNRDNSQDSREWGFVPEELIIGKGLLIWFSWDHDAKDVRWHRLFRKIQ